MKHLIGKKFINKSVSRNNPNRIGKIIDVTKMGLPNGTSVDMAVIKYRDFRAVEFINIFYRKGLYCDGKQY